MLKNHPDASADRGLAVGYLCFVALNEYLALIGFVKAVKDTHQCRFACTIFPDDPVDRTGHHPDRDILVGLNRAKGFGNTLQFNGRGLIGHGVAFAEQ